MDIITKTIAILKKSDSATHSSVEITTSVPIDIQTVSNITKLFDGKIIITQRIDPSIISGFIVKYGDLEIDSSFDKKIEDLSTHLNRITNESDSVLETMQKGIEEFRSLSYSKENGIVESVRDGVCFSSDLSGCMYQELVTIGKNVKGIAMNIEKKRVGIVILGDASKIKVGDKVERSKQVISIGVSDELLGRVINPLGEVIDGKPEINYAKSYPIEKVAPGVLARKPVDKPLLTGITAIDALIPIGRGQRELILGDRQTGKTSIAVDSIINQKDQNIICIYVAIGQKESKLARLVEKLNEKGALEYTIVVNAPASSPAAMQFISPYSATAIAEYFADKGKDVLVIYDDLSKHAVAYRELSLLLRRPPGREAYPGDVFYIHSRLLERSCNLSDEEGGGSITSLPIIETQAGDISAYIPTNVISITDGQIFLESDLFYKGIRPAINIGLSVSRVGSAAQTKPMKKVAGKLKLALAQFRELEAFSQFSGDLDPQTRSQIERGKKTTELLKQSNFEPVKNVDSILIIYGINYGMFDNYTVKEVREVANKFIGYVQNIYSSVYSTLQNNLWDDEIEAQLKIAIEEFLKQK
jgi:F-type H+-transporting ATPase subunit alpha